ncbi:hypothetical protein L0Y65_06435 [Candidatus Micrarchaeota archaeon]|nr:hypothetical protein [Candidatus Micrarchaeota archaeon]
MAPHLPRKKLLAYDKTEPCGTIGRRLVVPDLKGYLAVVHERDGWGPGDRDTQVLDGFGFNGRDFLSRLGAILGKDVCSVYFPLGYSGRVAKAIADAGCEVLASDLSPHWVGHMQAIGLAAEQRSFENVPDRRFDAVVSFEAYPVSDTLVGYLGMMGIMSRGLPFVEIFRNPYSAFFPDKPPWELEGAFARDNKGWYPSHQAMNRRTAYDYGARVRREDAFYGDPAWLDFEINAVIPDKRTARRAGLDLRVLAKASQPQAGDTISVSALSSELKRSAGEVAASLSRLIEVLNNRMLTIEGEMVAHHAGEFGSSPYRDEFRRLVRSVRIAV